MIRGTDEARIPAALHTEEICNHLWIEFFLIPDLLLGVLAFLLQIN